MLAPLSTIFDSPYRQAESEEAARRLHEVRAADPTLRGQPLTVEETHAEIDKMRLSEALKSWLRGVAAWGGDSREDAVLYGKRAKERGWL